jgi:ubiquinone/menaquinone biosynthesis C-methylase UbiE
MTTVQETNKDAYRTMWEEWGDAKKHIYLTYKFVPTHRVGLTNYVREKALLSCVPHWQNLRVLDVGCAAGNQLYSVQKDIAYGHGVDIADSLIDAAKEYSKQHGFDNLEFSRGEVEQLIFEDNTFDVVICGEVLEHVFDKDIALRELLRVLKVGGTLCISIPNLNADGTWWGRLMRTLGLRSFTPIAVFSKEEIAAHGDAHVREYTGSDLRAWFTSYPVSITRLTSASYLDGPYFDFCMRVLLKVSPLRAAIIWCEHMLSKTGITWGRHLVVGLIKK